MDDVDIAQAKLEGKCYICDCTLPTHKMSCPERFGTWGQFGFTKKHTQTEVWKQLELALEHYNQNHGGISDD